MCNKSIIVHIILFFRNPHMLNARYYYGQLGIRCHAMHITYICYRDYVTKWFHILLVTYAYSCSGYVYQWIDFMYMSVMNISSHAYPMINRHIAWNCIDLHNSLLLLSFSYINIVSVNHNFSIFVHYILGKSSKSS